MLMNDRRFFLYCRKNKSTFWFSNCRIKLAVVGMLSAIFSSTFAQTHCRAEEEVVFSCKIAKSRKVVSLCAISKSSNGEKKALMLQYRFGKLMGTPEFQFPPSETNSLKQFRLYEYLRPDLVSTSVSFENSGFYYVINESEDQHSVPSKLAGVSVISRERNTQLNLTCETKSVYSDWSTVSGVIPCDEEMTLNACE